jgi:hypothetical protein
MAKVKISEFDVNPDNNTDINNINIAEGCAPSGINNAIRQLMSDLKAFQTGADGDPFNGAVNGTVGATTPATGAFTTLSASSTVSGTGFSTYLASPPAIGGTAAAAGAFTSLSASGAFSANGGTTLGDASGDALTINSSAVSIPNGLNFDSNTLVIDATNNNVGVGTASPSSYNSVADNLVVAGSADSGLTIASGTSSGGSIFFADGTTGTDPYRGFVQYVHTSDYMGFGTSGSEQMRINSSGNLGIGTGNPTYKLDVLRSGNGVVFRAGNGTSYLYTYADASGAYISSDAGVNTGIGFFNANFIALYANSAERMRIDSSGNVGIGTTSAFGTLNVNRFSSTPYTTITLGDFATPANAVGLYFRTNGSNPAGISTGGSPLAFYVGGPATTEAMRIDSSGSVGIGTSSPTARLEVSGSAAQNFIVNSTSAASYMQFANSGGITGYIGSAGGINSTGGNNALGLRSQNEMAFATGGSTERMRIDSSGNLLVGITTNSASSKMIISGAGTSGAYLLRLGSSATGGATADGLDFIFGDGASKGNIRWNSSVTAYNTTSDYRLKENVVPMSDALAVVGQLKPCTYTWKVNGSSGQGFIAHELQAVVPDCVTGEKDAVEIIDIKDAEGNVIGQETKPVYQGIDTSFLVATLTASIQELKAIVDAQAARILVLESK